MTELFQKLNLKAQNPILVAYAPPSFAAETAAITDRMVHPEPIAGVSYSYCLLFAANQSELVARAAEAVQVTTADAILWFAYPKQTSKAFRSDLNRDLLWKLLAPLGLGPNRQVAIDDDWSALRFKKL